MAKIDIYNYLKAFLSDAMDNGGCVNIDAMVDYGIEHERINSDMTRKESERFYWMRIAETVANSMGFYSISKGVYLNYQKRITWRAGYHD